MADTCVLPGWNPNLTSQEVWTLLLREEEDETVYKLPTFTLLTLMMLVGLPGNILVLLVYGFRFPASTTKNFIMAMAVFDLINCALGLPFEMVDLRYDIELDIPVACKVIRFWISLSACGSVTVLVAVSVDRFRRICQPFRKQMTVRQSKFVVASLTLLSVGFSVPALLLYGRHTEVRYGIELHDCSIDDVYKSGTFAAVYQYTLGITWVLSIMVLVTMYSFVIYKIQLQKKRRHKLSSQSHDSTAVLATHRVHTNDISRTHNGLTRSSNEHSSFITCTPATASLTNNRNVSGAGDGDSAKIKGTRFVNRLFSRDVNPILEDDEEEETGQLVYDSCDEDMPLPDFEFSAKLIKYKKTSLNNYLAGSRDTQLTNMSDSIPQTEAAESSRFDQAQEVSVHRTRKYGYSFGRYRPWESDSLMPNVGIISSVWDRGCISHSDLTLARSRVHSHGDRCHAGRSSSLCSLKSVRCQCPNAPANQTPGCCGNGQGFENWKHVNNDKAQLPELDDKAQLPELDDKAQLPELDDKARLPELDDKAQLPELDDKARLPELDDKARLPELDNDKARLPELDNDKVQLPELDNDKARLPELDNDKARLPELDDKAQLPELDNDENATPDACLDCALLNPNGKVNSVSTAYSRAHATPPESQGHQLNISESQDPCSQPGAHLVTDPCSQPDAHLVTDPCSQPVAHLVTDQCSQPGAHLVTDPYLQPGAHLVTDPVKRHQPGHMDTSVTLIKKKKTLSREIKTSRVSMMMLMVTLGFVLSYLPHLCIQIYKNMSSSSVSHMMCSSHAYFVMLHVLVRSFFINNAINPIIYSFYNKTFRERCLRLLRTPKSLLQSSEPRTGHALSFSQDNDTS